MQSLHLSRRSRKRRENATGYLFVAPAAILIGMFGIFPLLFTVYVSLFKWRLRKGSFILLENYGSLLGGNPLLLLAVLASIAGFVFAPYLLRRRKGRAGRAALLGGALVLAVSLVAFVASLPYLAQQGDKELFDSLRVTVWYSALTVPVQLAAGMLLAVLLSRKLAAKQAFRVIFLIPYIAPTVATAAVFELLLSLRPDSFANQVLLLFGLQPLQWLQEAKGILTMIFGVTAPASNAGVLSAYWREWAMGPSLALVSIIFYSWWVFIGYYALIYTNGLSNIPRQLYEAAEVDGASRLRSFFSITVPLLSPTTYFLSVLGVIGTFKAFTHIYVLRNAAALGTVDPVSISIFYTFYRKGLLGYASAMSILLFAIVLGLTMIQKGLERRVTYGD